MSRTSLDPSRIWLVIPVHGRIALTRACLQSIRDQTVSGSQVVVVDDGSPDDTRDVLRSDWPQVHVVEGDGNLWWAGAMNFGVRHAIRAGAEYVVSVNNDTVLDGGFLEEMMAAAAARPAAIMGSLIRDLESGEVVYGGGRVRWLTAGWEQVYDGLAPEERSGLHPVTHCPGRGLWIPAQVFKTIGYFDAKRLPQSAADFEFTMRARRAGYELYCNYQAVVLTRGDIDVGGRRSDEDRRRWGVSGGLFDSRSGNYLPGRVALSWRYAPALAKLPFLLFSVVRAVAGRLGLQLRRRQRR